MEERKQFTFFISYWQAIEELPEKDQLPILKAIIKYALFGEEPTALRGVRRAVFLLVKPTLDSGRKKAASGKQGGSKSKAKGKQNAKEKEVEGEKEMEVEMEKEYESNDSGGDGDFAGATDDELAMIGLKPGEYLGVTSADVRMTIAKAQDLVARYAPGRCCTTADCRKVFTLAAWRREDGYRNVDEGGLLEYAFEQAMLNGKAGIWNYIEGILNRCLARDIYTAEEARAFDEERPDKETGWGQ